MVVDAAALSWQAFGVGGPAMMSGNPKLRNPGPADSHAGLEWPTAFTPVQPAVAP